MTCGRTMVRYCARVVNGSLKMLSCSMYGNNRYVQFSLYRFGSVAVIPFGNVALRLGGRYGGYRLDTSWYVWRARPSLLEVVGALHAGRGLADLLNGRQEQTDQDRDDGDDDEEFDEREGTPATGGTTWSHLEVWANRAEKRREGAQQTACRSRRFGGSNSMRSSVFLRLRFRLV